MVCSYICCGTCCTIFSVVCVLFLGGLASTIKGSGHRLYLADDEFDEAYDAVLQAIYGYLTCIFISVLMYIYGSKKAQAASNSDADSSDPRKALRAPLMPIAMEEESAI